MTYDQVKSEGSVRSKSFMCCILLELQATQPTLVSPTDWKMASISSIENDLVNGWLCQWFEHFVEAVSAPPYRGHREHFWQVSHTDFLSKRDRYEPSSMPRWSNRYWKIKQEVNPEAKVYINTNLKQWSEILRNEYVYRTDTFWNNYIPNSSKKGSKKGHSLQTFISRRILSPGLQPLVFSVSRVASSVNMSIVDIWVFPKIGIPQNGWFIKEYPIKMDDLGGKPTIFGNITHGFGHLVLLPNYFF